ncbi:MAG: ribonuclease HI [Syntrophobacteraceae bacterium]
MPAVPISVSQLDEMESSFISGRISQEEIRLLIATCRAFLSSGVAPGGELPESHKEVCVSENGVKFSETRSVREGLVETRISPSGGPIHVFSDGACSGNPGPGGWGAIIVNGKSRKELKGGERHTTNNIMEMTAAIRALETLEPNSSVTVTTDSQYLKNGITSWINGWKRNGWRTADKKPVKNQALWLRLDELNQLHKITWKWVRGHAGHPENERCDELARMAITCLR